MVVLCKKKVNKLLERLEEEFVNMRVIDGWCYINNLLYDRFSYIKDISIVRVGVWI